METHPKIRNEGGVNAQSRAGSAVEVTVAALVSYAIIVASGQWLYPTFGYDITLQDNFGLSAVFFMISLCVKFGFRRYFNARPERD